MKDYLKKYESSEKQVDPQEEDNENDSAEERPVVDEEIEVKRMRRLEEIKARRAEDGSGWVSLSSDRPGRRRRLKTRNDSPSPEPGPRDVNKKSNDLSSPRRRRYHSPSPEPGRKPSKSLGSNSDFSPPRRSVSVSVKGSRDSDLSPQRKTVSRSPPPRRPRRQSPPPPNKQGATEDWAN
ncbi:hypothetical protein F2Q70_00022492 [Brassica cretica]|uniref:Uncharacterized protein n=1 Tax=Brassica cretica TaxID=69181 RepID=A0A8S9GVA5_BRACR|nr:hypothetical protein F2Q70_00022492 [Brassica cretica]